LKEVNSAMDGRIFGYTYVTEKRLRVTAAAASVHYSSLENYTLLCFSLTLPQWF